MYCLCHCAVQNVLSGTGGFMSISTLLKQSQSEASEYESCFYVLLYLLAGGDLPWRHFSVSQEGAYAKCFLIQSEFQKVLDIIPSTVHTKILQLREIFFPVGKYDLSEVTFEKMEAGLHYMDLI